MESSRGISLCLKKNNYNNITSCFSHPVLFSLGIQICGITPGHLAKQGLLKDCPDGLLTLQESRWFLIMPYSQLDAPQLANN